MARTKSPVISYADLQKKCKELGINSWEKYKVRYKEIEGSKKTLHAVYAGQWKGNRAFFGTPAKVAEKKESAKTTATTKKTAPKSKVKPAAKKANGTVNRKKAVANKK